jgi:hypothetical protein
MKKKLQDVASDVVAQSDNIALNYFWETKTFRNSQILIYPLRPLRNPVSQQWLSNRQ